jgi:hypothetical protein
MPTLRKNNPETVRSVNNSVAIASMFSMLRDLTGMFSIVKAGATTSGYLHNLNWAVVVDFDTLEGEGGKGLREKATSFNTMHRCPSRKPRQVPV